MSLSRHLENLNMKTIAWTVFGLLAAALPAWAQNAGSYSPWVKNEQQNRWECTYTYPNKTGGTSKQVVAVYPKDNARAGWAYFYNDQGKPWGRCAIKGNPKYEPKVMYWQELTPKADGYQDFKQPKGFCPAPKDGKTPIPTFPDPPI